MASVRVMNKSNQGDSPPRIPGWRLKDSPNLPDCVEIDKEVPIHTTKEGIAFVRTPDEQFHVLPYFDYKPHYALVDGLRMHYIDEGPNDGEIVLLLHGQPTWAYLYRKMIPPIVQGGHRVIAVDHIGMGRSDKPIDIGIHTFEQHVAWHKQFIQSLNLSEITLFCQDWGSLMGLRVAGDQPDWFARIIVANGTLPIIPQGMNPFRVPNPVEIDCTLGSFQEFMGMPQRLTVQIDDTTAQRAWAQFFPRWIHYALTAPNFTPSQVVQTGSYIDIPSQELEAYDLPFPNFIYKAAIRTFPSMVAAIEDHNLPAWKNLGQFNRPFLFLGGDHDMNMGRQENQERLTNHIPGAKGQPHERYPHAAHFIQEDEGQRLGEKVSTFITATPNPK
jgi:pimeloyl-ACP methyl ester carboxylesterase